MTARALALALTGAFLFGWACSADHGAACSVNVPALASSSDTDALRKHCARLAGYDLNCRCAVCHAVPLLPYGVHIVCLRSDREVSCSLVRPCAERSLPDRLAVPTSLAQLKRPLACMYKSCAIYNLDPPCPGCGPSQRFPMLRV